MKKTAITLALGLIAFSLTVGKPTPERAAARQTPEALKQWGFMIGEWAMDSTRYSLEGPVIENSAGTATFSWGMEGLRIEERQSAVLNGRDMLVLNLFAFNPEREAWEIAWTDSLHNGFSVMRGTSVEDRIVLFEKNPRPGAEVTRRVTYARQGKDRFSRLLEFSLDGGESWLRRSETVYTRHP